MSTKAECITHLDASIHRLLHSLMDKVDKQPFEERCNKVSGSLSRIKGLASPEQPGQDQDLWDQLKALEQAQLIHLDMKARIDRLADPWRSCRGIVLLPEQESALREALNRPDPRVGRGAFDALKASCPVWKAPELLQPSFCPSVLEYDEWLNGLAQIPSVIESARQQGRKLSCYQISARVFQGRSKLLTDRETWLEKIFDLPGAILIRPLIINASLVTNPDQLLFIENKDTYRDLCNVSQREGFGLKNTVLIYSEGFTAGAERIRRPDGVAIHLDSASTTDPQSIAWLRTSLSATDEVPRYFFGDIDWSGAQILQRLISVFPGLRAWQPGYQVMLDFLTPKTEQDSSTDTLPARRGHTLAMASKQGQRPVEATGDAWFDEQILPLIAKGCCVDQEIL